MSVTAPPRPPRRDEPLEREEIENLVEALIEEARQRAQRRRRIRGAVVAGIVLAAATILAVSERTAHSQSPSGAATARPALAGGTVKVVIAGTNDRQDVTDGSLAGRGTFRATGAIRDAGPALAYRTVNASGTSITLRFVTKGGKGTITYVVRIDTTTGTSRWTIASGTKAYAGMHGKGTESENADYTVSVLKGTVSR